MRVPSARDQRIFVEVHALGRTQVEVAAEFQVTQGRVSQIVKRVGVWRALADAVDAGELKDDDRRRLDRYVDRQVIVEVRARALREFRRSEPLSTTREGKRGETAFHETVRRDRPANVQCLKVALNATKMLWELDDRPQPLPSGQRRWGALDLRETMRDTRHRLELSGKVPKCGNINAMVDRMLGELKGEEPAGDAERPESASHAERGREVEGVERDAERPESASHAERGREVEANANTVNTSAESYEPEFPPEVLAAVAASYAGVKSSAKEEDDLEAAAFRKRVEEARQKDLIISAQAQRERDEADERRRNRWVYVPPLDLGWQPRTVHVELTPEQRKALLPKMVLIEPKE
jgi:hypothetical protein